MNFGDLKPVLDKIISLLTKVERHTGCASCGGDTPVTLAGVDASIPAGLKSVAIVKTSPSSDTVTITLSDASTYIMTENNEVFTDSSGGGASLPEYVIVGPGTWKWHGIQ